MAKTQLPGFGRPLNYVPDKNDPEFVGRRFPSALSQEDLSQLLTIGCVRQSTPSTIDIPFICSF